MSSRWPRIGARFIRCVSLCIQFDNRKLIVMAHIMCLLLDYCRCDFDKTNTLPFVISFGIGAFFFVLSGLISFYLDKIGAKKLICKFG